MLREKVDVDALAWALTPSPGRDIAPRVAVLTPEVTGVVGANNMVECTFQGPGGDARVPGPGSMGHVQDGPEVGQNLCTSGTWVGVKEAGRGNGGCLLYTSPSPRD